MDIVAMATIWSRETAVSGNERSVGEDQALDVDRDVVWLGWLGEHGGDLLGGRVADRLTAGQRVGNRVGGLPQGHAGSEHRPVCGAWSTGVERQPHAARVDA